MVVMLHCEVFEVEVINLVSVEYVGWVNDSTVLIRLGYMSC
jgi:hypothetical protein